MLTMTIYDIVANRQFINSINRKIQEEDKQLKKYVGLRLQHINSTKKKKGITWLFQR